jgi:hypothetical protein
MTKNLDRAEMSLENALCRRLLGLPESGALNDSQVESAFQAGIALHSFTFDEYCLLMRARRRLLATAIKTEPEPFSNFVVKWRYTQFTSEPENPSDR